jgi:Sulfotransferase family
MAGDTPGRLPTFLIIGAMKSGTTALHRYLGMHPDVFFAKQKELHFFAIDDPGNDGEPPGNWHRGLDWYRAQFTGSAGYSAVGEATPKYTRWPRHRGVPERISRTLPGARLVYVVRHPLERMTAHYLHEVSRGAEQRDMNRAFASDDRYLDASRYAMQLDQYLHYFGEEQILVVSSEQLRSDYRGTVEAVAGFVGVDPELVPETPPEPVHVTADKRSPSTALGSLRRIPGRSRAPEWARRAVLVAASRPIDAWRIPIDPGLEENLREVLRADADRLRPLPLVDVDSWDL